MNFRIIPILVVMVLVFTGCRTAYYSAWEKVGVYKRDLLKEAVEEARDEQKEASQQFKDALTRLKELYGFKGGDLEKYYDALKADYDQSAAKADSVRKRISEMDSVAKDLFAEWEKELADISSANLRDNSRRQLRETRARYETLHTALRRAEASMEPVLVQLRDHVIYLKHNLNAQAIASLKGEATNIQTDISNLISQMNASIAKADEFIKTLP